MGHLLYRSFALPLQPRQQLLAHLHGGAELPPQLVGLLHQGGAQDGSGGLAALPLLHGRPQPLDLAVLLVVGLTPDALQLQLLLSEL